LVRGRALRQKNPMACAFLKGKILVSRRLAMTVYKSNMHLKSMVFTNFPMHCSKDSNLERQIECPPDLVIMNDFSEKVKHKR